MRRASSASSRIPYCSTWIFSRCGIVPSKSCVAGYSAQPMVAGVEVVRDREARIRVYLADLKTLSAIPEDAFLQNRERQYAVLHAVQLAIEASVDIATQIRAADDLGIPASYAEAFDLLETHRVVDVGLATDMRATDIRAMARFRNRIVHFYGAVDAVPRTTPMSPILGFGSWDLDLGIWD